MALASVAIFFSAQYAVGLEVPSADATEATSTAVSSGPAQPASPQAGQELVDKRTRTSKTFATDQPGKYTTVLESGSIHYRDQAGKWAEIDTTLVDDGQRLKNKANSFGLEIDKDSRAARLSTLRIDEAHAIGFGVKGAGSSTREKQTERVVFKETLSGIDLKLDSMASGLKESVILKNRNAQNVFDFPLYLEGLSPSLDADGNVLYTDETGAERLRTPHGFMVDSNINPDSGEPRRSDDVTYELLSSGGATTLRVTASREWLDGPERIYPVTVDPSFWLSTPWDDDMFVGEGWYNDFSNDPELKVGRVLENGVWTTLHQSYMHFSVSGLDGKVIDDAAFFILNTHSYACGAGAARGVGGYRITQPWAGHQWRSTFPDSLPQGNQIVWAAFAMGRDPCGDGWAFWDVTGPVRNWTSNAWEEHGIGMRVDIGSEWDSYAWKRFASWNTGLALSQCPIPVPTEANSYLDKCRPHIDIHWHEPNRRPDPPYYIYPPANATLNYPDPSLFANNWDPDGNNVALRFRLYREADGAYMGGKDGGWICSGCQDSWYAGTLRDGRYYWDEWAYDGQYDSAPVRNYFTIAVPPNAPDNLGPNDGAISQSAPALSALYYDRNGAQDPDGGWIDFEIADSSFQRIDLRRVAASNNQTVSTGALALTDGVYNWRASSNDGVYSAGPTPWRSFTVDKGTPAAPQIVDSQTHGRNFPYPARDITMRWTAGSDVVSGVAGYSWALNGSQATPADAIADTTALSVVAAAQTDGTWWFHVRAVDKAGNASADVSYGPLSITQAAVTLPRPPDVFEQDHPCLAAPGFYDPQNCTAPANPAAPPRSESLDAYRSLYGYNGPYYSPVTSGNAVVVMNNSITTTSSGGWRAWGLVRNETVNPVGTVTVTAALYDKKNQLVGQASGVVPVKPLRPHEPAPFALNSSVLASKVANVVYTVTTGPATVDTRQLRLLTSWEQPYGTRNRITEPYYTDPASGPFPHLQFGLLRNESAVPLAAPQVVAAWLDANGKVIWVQTAPLLTDTATAEPALQPGELAPFLVSVSDPIAGPRLSNEPNNLLLWGSTQ